jgi:cytochrome c oxidase cbb3-type subunit 1
MSASQSPVTTEAADAPPVYSDTAVRQFIIMTVVWGIVGMAVGVLIAAELTWPDLDLGQAWLSYGRLRPLHTNAPDV